MVGMSHDDHEAQLVYCRDGSGIVRGKGMIGIMRRVVKIKCGKSTPISGYRYVPRCCVAGQETRQELVCSFLPAPVTITRR